MRLSPDLHSRASGQRVTTLAMVYNRRRLIDGTASMLLVEDLQRRVEQEPSLFRAQLMREDIARLQKLQLFARSAQNLEEFKKAGVRIGWTQGDLRTHELQAPLETLLENVFSYETRPAGAEQESRIVDAWLELHRTRMERLLGCLSTPTPKPAGDR